MSKPILERFEGCLMGLAVGDALGARFEAQSPGYIRGRFSTTDELLYADDDELWYTDDTQMAIGVAETLVAHGRIIEERLCDAFVMNYQPTRGYGRGARAVIQEMGSGGDYRSVAQQYFPGGSYGNGAAMRVAPVGLFFRDEHERVLEQARLSALPTHVHPLGVEGAELLALAVAHVLQTERFDRGAFFEELLASCRSDEYRQKLEMASHIEHASALPLLGNGIEALESAPTAIACFALFPNSYEETIATAIFLGGDTDTIAAMAGALSGAYLGIGAIPDRLIKRLEETPKGRSYILRLADELLAASEA
jgi:poly(ADP-ribose) glycohydrolase ARH3